MKPAIVQADDTEMPHKPKIDFTWAFGAITGSETDQRFVSVGRNTRLTGGNKIKIYIELREM